MGKKTKKCEKTALHRKNWEGNFQDAEENLGPYSHWFWKGKPIHIKQFHSKSLKTFWLIVYYKNPFALKRIEPCKNLYKTLKCALRRAKMFT